MISFDLNFFPSSESRGAQSTDFDYVLESWLGSVYRNGNVLEHGPIVELTNHLQVRVLTPAPEALQKSNWDAASERDWEKLERLFLSPARFELVGRSLEEAQWCQCAAPSGQFLFTRFLYKGSPVSCFDCWHAVPLYRVPILKLEVDRFRYRNWQEDYNALDRLWMDSSVGEQFAYRHLARPKSDFMKGTRDLAAQLELTSGVPTYSFLLHYHKKWSKRCPLCGCKWRWKDSPSGVLAFKCDHCRLVSSEASDKAKPLRELHE